MSAEIIQGTVLLAGINAAGEPVLLKLNDDGTLSGGSGVSLGSTPSTQAMGDSPSGGSDTTASKNDHKHGMPSFGASAANIGTSSGGVATTPSRSDHIHAIPDQLVTSRMVNLTQSTVEVATEETTTSTSYVDLATVGPAITLTPGIAQDHGIYVNCDLKTNVLSTPLASVAIAGAAASDVDAARHDGTALSRSSRLTIATAQASGATHTMKYRVVSQTGTFGTRRILGIAL